MLRPYQQEARLKICSICKVQKSVNEFYTNGNKIKSACKICSRKQVKIYNENNREKYLSCKKQYRKNNKEKIKKYQKEWYEKNKEHVKEYTKKYNGENRETIKIRKQKYRSIEKNKLTEKKSRAKYYRNKKLNDAEFKLKSDIRRQFSIYIKRQLNRKDKIFFHYTKIYLNEYCSHLKKDPLWNEWIKRKGNIHIDHVIPVNAYNYNKGEDIKKCWNPRNLRFITAKENMSKKDIVDFDLIRRYNIYDLLPEGFGYEQYSA